MQRKRSIALLAVWFAAPLCLVACKRNTPEQRAAAESAADAYCECVGAQGERTPAELATADMGVCEAEGKAFDRAWEALPIRGQDPKADAIFTYQHECYTLLSDMLDEYRK